MPPPPENPELESRKRKLADNGNSGNKGRGREAVGHHEEGSRERRQWRRAAPPRGGRLGAVSAPLRLSACSGVFGHPWTWECTREKKQLQESDGIAVFLVSRLFAALHSFSWRPWLRDGH